MKEEGRGIFYQPRLCDFNVDTCFFLTSATVSRLFYVWSTHLTMQYKLCAHIPMGSRNERGESKLSTSGVIYRLNTVEHGTIWMLTLANNWSSSLMASLVLLTMRRGGVNCYCAVIRGIEHETSNTCKNNGLDSGEGTWKPFQQTALDYNFRYFISTHCAWHHAWNSSQKQIGTVSAWLQPKLPNLLRWLWKELKR